MTDLVHENHLGYPFQPLNHERREIRLLTICSRDQAKGVTNLLDPADKSLLKCELTHVYLDDSPKYYALSYVWGDDTEMKSIIINNRVIMIRKNLWLFLQRLRNFEWCMPQFCCWVDFVCINQTAIGERNHQVHMMDDIYKSAIATCSWLGNGKQTMNPGLKSRGMKMLAKRTIRKVFEGPDWSRGPFDAFDVFGGPYWQRLWVMQEVALAMEVIVIYAGVRAKWSDLTLLRSTIKGGPYDDHGRNTDENGTIVKYTYDTLNEVRSQNETQPIFQLLDAFSHNGCGDVRDKLYGLLSMAKKKDRQALPINYNLSPIEVLLSLSKYLQRPEIRSQIKADEDGLSWLDPLTLLLDKLWHEWDLHPNRLVNSSDQNSVASENILFTKYEGLAHNREQWWPLPDAFSTISQKLLPNIDRFPTQTRIYHINTNSISYPRYLDRSWLVLTTKEPLPTDVCITIKPSETQSFSTSSHLFPPPPPTFSINQRQASIMLLVRQHTITKHDTTTSKSKPSIETEIQPEIIGRGLPLYSIPSIPERGIDLSYLTTKLSPYATHKPYRACHQRETNSASNGISSNPYNYDSVFVNPAALNEYIRLERRRAIITSLDKECKDKPQFTGPPSLGAGWYAIPGKKDVDDVEWRYASAASSLYTAGRGAIGKEKNRVWLPR